MSGPDVVGVGCCVLGGRAGIPTRQEVFDFLAGRGAET